MDILKKLQEEFKLRDFQVKNTVKLLDEGNTIPFIARYRKEQTGSLEDIVIRDLAKRLDYLRNLEERKLEVVRLIEEQDKLTGELEAEIRGADSLQKIDDLYRPFRPKRRTRATIARERGLEPLAQLILDQSMAEEDFLKEAASYIDGDQELEGLEDVIAGCQDIIAEMVSDDPKLRDYVRKQFLSQGIIVSKASQPGESSVYEMYYDFKEPIRKLANHRVLAINRGEKDKFLKVSLELAELDPVEGLQARLVKKGASLAGYYCQAIEDGYNRLLFPSIEREIRNSLREEAEEEAIKVFALNLEPLLLQPPLRGKRVMAIDPGFRTGCKLAIIDEIGNFKDYATIYPTEPRNDVEASKKTMARLIDKYGVDVIAIGNGTASRETELVVAELIKELDRKLAYIIVSEAGASIYSASDIAREEFPDLDVSIRGAVSIARRLLDPLAELVKIEPKHIGVGQYQHDLNQKKLDESLRAVVEDSVNNVGVNLNTASASLLAYVAGISKRLAGNLLAHREEIGRFTSRKELLKVKGLGPKTFVQCAGFLRIPDSENILDNTAVHPESYKVAEKLLEMDYRTRELGEISRELEVGIPTLKDIIRELEKPGRDPRDENIKPILREDVLKIEDLKEGMVVKGTVRNVVDFGAFVDIGVTEDGLVHISQMSNKFVNHPKDLVQLGDIVDVRILDIDIDKGRIGLSMKDI